MSDYFKNIFFCHKLASESKCSFAYTVDWSKVTNFELLRVCKEAKILQDLIFNQFYIDTSSAQY
jgi:hypothetical protein